MSSIPVSRLAADIVCMQQEEEEDTGEPLILWEPSSGEGSP